MNHVFVARQDEGLAGQRGRPSRRGDVAAIPGGPTIAEAHRGRMFGLSWQTQREGKPLPLTAVRDSDRPGAPAVGLEPAGWGAPVDGLGLLEARPGQAVLADPRAPAPQGAPGDSRRRHELATALTAAAFRLERGEVSAVRATLLRILLALND